MTRNPVGKLLLFGATGDLSQRMLLPSLFNLHADGLLPEGLTITGTARSDHDDASFREFAAPPAPLPRLSSVAISRA